MNRNIGHPGFLGLSEQVTLGGMGAAFNDEEETKVSKQGGGGPALSWQSTAHQGTQRAGGGGLEWTVASYDPGPDGIVGTEDDIGVPQTLEDYLTWWDEWYLPNAYQENSMFHLAGMNTISGLSGINWGNMGIHDPNNIFEKFFMAWQFGIAEWGDLMDWIDGTVG